LTKDLATILDGWEYDPSQVNARWISDMHGHAKVQLRLDMGLMEMEIQGRPDGRTPRGFSSVLEYYQSLESADNPDHPALQLNEQACMELQQEMVQYYYRYLALHALGHLDGVITDTQHSLAIIDLVGQYALDDEIAWQFLQFYPYVRMMHARAISEKAMRIKDFKRAIQALEAGIADIEEFWDEYGDPEDEGWESEESDFLRQTLHTLHAKRPKTRAETLTEDLERAIATENYEKAAKLRDALRTLHKQRV